MPKSRKIDKDKIEQPKNIDEEISRIEEDLKTAKGGIKGNPHIVTYLDKLEDRIQKIEEAIGLRD